MRFDWYSATIKHPFENFIDGVTREFEWALPERVHPYKRYDRATAFDCGDERILRADSNEESGDILVTATSHNAPRIADYLRQLYPDHSVSRADVCEDYTGHGVFDQLDSLFVGFALKGGIKLNQHGDWLRKDGRTRYVGSPSSSSMVRVYEKGWQQYYEAKKTGSPIAEGFDITRTRVETQVRPQSRDKKAAAKYSASDIMSYSTWTREAHSLMAGFQLAAPLKHTRARSDHEQKMCHLAKQYGNTITAELERCHGSFEALGSSIFEHIQQLQRNLSRAGNVAKSAVPSAAEQSV